MNNVQYQYFLFAHAAAGGVRCERITPHTLDRYHHRVHLRGLRGGLAWALRFSI